MERIIKKDPLSKKEIKKGDFFSLDNIGFFRYNKIYSGLEPKFFFRLKNKKSKINIKKNKILTKKIFRYT